MLFDDKYYKNIEWVGLALTYIIFLISSYYLSNDLATSPKKGDPVMYIFIIAIAFIAVSISIFVLTFYILYYKFSRKKQNIKLNRDDKNNFDTFKRLFVSAIVLLYILCFFFFTLYKDPATNKYNNFFDINFGEPNVGPLFKISMLPQLNFPAILDYTILSIKIVVSISLVVISSYMVYLSSLIYNAKDLQIYSSQENEYNIHKKDISNSFWMFRNLNMNYLLNYKFDIGMGEP
jgi:hypothetical protein